MSILKTAWANLQDGLGNRFSWSHVKAIFYNYAEHKLLSTKLDEMDALIDAKIAKAMMSSVQVNDKSKVPTSALAYSMSQEISQNEQNIAKLNSNKAPIDHNHDGKYLQRLSARINSITFQDGINAPILNVDNTAYPIIKGPAGGNFTARTLSIKTNPNTQKRALYVEWYADGHIYYNYCDFTD